jgi:hypothetical protein
MRGSKFQTEIEAPTYLGDLPNQPFPLNPFFRSEAVLTDSKKNAIYDMVTREKQSLKAVSAKHGVDVRRVAAVIRLGAIERDWRAKVRQTSSHLPPSLPCRCRHAAFMMIPFHKSISLEDAIHGYTFGTASLADSSCPPILHMFTCHALSWFGSADMDMAH